MDRSNAKTPPSLFGIDRKIAYANKKYHSGWIWGGVLKGLALLKFSGSPNINGFIIVNIIKKKKKRLNPIISLIVKKLWNGIFIKFLLIPMGLEDPFVWRNVRWIITINNKMNGNKKWKE